MTEKKDNFDCKLCNKSYKDASGLWRHNKKHHVIQIDKHDDTPNIKIYSCCKCNKQFANRVSKWRHEKTCCNSTSNDLSVLKNEVKDLRTKMDKMSTNPTIVNNYTQNNIVISYAPGYEPINSLTNEQKKFIMNKGLLSLMYLIETTNFDKSKPENHSYCVTALNDKHASMIDTKTNQVIKTDKMELFDKVLIGNINKLEKLSGDKAFSEIERKTHIETINKMKDILFNNKRGMKKYYSEVNLLSYNNKDLIQDTWNSLKKLDELLMSKKFPIDKNTKTQSFLETIDLESDVDSDDEITTEKLNKLKKQCESTKKLIPENYDTDGSELSNDSDSDSEFGEASVLQVNFKGKIYLVEGKNVYNKNFDGTKGQVYGTYINGIVSKIKQKEIEV